MKRAKPHARLKRFVKDILDQTPFTGMVLLLVVLWLLFSAGVYVAEQNGPQTHIDSYGAALYWGVAAASTAGIADTPGTAAARFIGAAWILIGSVLFFGTIVATVTAYFMRPMQRPHKKIIETIEYNLEQLDDLTVEELDLLKDTVNALIANVENLKEKRAKKSA